MYPPTPIPHGLSSDGCTSLPPHSNLPQRHVILTQSAPSPSTCDGHALFQKHIALQLKHPPLILPVLISVATQKRQQGFNTSHAVHPAHTHPTSLQHRNDIRCLPNPQATIKFHTNVPVDCATTTGATIRCKKQRTKVRPPYLYSILYSSTPPPLRYPPSN